MELSGLRLGPIGRSANSAGQAFIPEKNPPFARQGADGNGAASIGIRALVSNCRIAGHRPNSSQTIIKTGIGIASKGFPNPIDVHVGSRIRLRRTLLGLSQSALAQSDLPSSKF